MSEQKVWVDSELLKYDDLSLCCTKDFDNKFYTNNYSLVDNEEYFEATFKDIKDHNRELVAKVLDKVKRKVDYISMHTITKERLMIMCEEIQQEFEDENNKN